jgi:CBS domain-containing protein
MKVKEVMHKGATWVESTALLPEVAKRMRESDVGVLPVRADGHIVGIITDRDITCRAVAESGNVGGVAAKDVMTKDVSCCSPDDDVTVAIKAMETKKIRRMPVTDSHKAIIGMLSLGDISHKVSNQLSAEVLRAVSGHHA